MDDLYSMMRILHSNLGQQVEEKTLWSKDQALVGLAVAGLTFVHPQLTKDQKAYVLAFLYMSSVREPSGEVFVCSREDLQREEVVEPCLRKEA